MDVPCYFTDFVSDLLKLAFLVSRYLFHNLCHAAAADEKCAERRRRRS